MKKTLDKNSKSKNKPDEFKVFVEGVEKPIYRGYSKYEGKKVYLRQIELNPGKLIRLFENKICIFVSQELN